jgi:hypothetical protein
MDDRQKQIRIRLGLGLILNVGLWFVTQELAKWSSLERELRWNLIGTCLAAATVVFVTPVFWRGKPGQAPIAFVLIFFLPGWVMYAVVVTIVKYW